MGWPLRAGRNLPPHPDDVREGLREAAERRSLARRDEQDALLDIGDWLVAAQEIDVSGDLTFSEAIRVAGVSRRTAYALVRQRVSPAPSAPSVAGDTQA
jgi:hypothetical protein